MKKLTCHCGTVEAEVNVPEKGFEKTELGWGMEGVP